MTSRNYMSGLDAFLSAWDGDARLECCNSVSSTGNVNIGGDPASVEASILTKNDPRFLDSIEVGVRPLVSCLTGTLDLITYSSCEGHRSTAESNHRCRHAGIVPRGKAEHDAFIGVLRRAAFEASNENIEVLVVEDVLDSQTRSIPCIDVFFSTKSYDEDCYFQDLDKVCGELVAAILRRALKSRVQKRFNVQTPSRCEDECD